MGGFEVRRNGVTIAVADVSALRALARDGGLAAEDAVRAEGADWTPAGAHPALEGAFAARSEGDPWAAWNDVDAVDAASLYRELREQGVEELPAEALTPVAGGAAPAAHRVDEPDALPEDALAAADEDMEPPIRAAAPAAAASPGARRMADAPGELIDFPRTSARASAAPPMMPEFTRRERPERQERSAGARSIRSVAMLLGTVVLAVVGVSFLRAVPEPDAAAVDVAPPAAERTPAPQDDPLRQAMARVEAELRGKMPPVPRPIKDPGALGDALMLEMTQLGVQVNSVDANVVKYVGRRQDEPKTVELRVSYVPGARSAAQGSVDAQAAGARDIGAMALVVGRYVRVYRLEVPVFEVTDMSTLSKSLIVGTQAEAWYLGRVPFPKLMESVQRL